MPLRYQPGTPDEPCISGMNAGAMIRSMRELYGEPTVARALAALPVDARDEFAGAHALRWIRGSTLDAVVASLAELLDRTPDAVYDAVMRHGGQRWFKLAWRVLLGLVGDEALIARCPMVFGKTRNCGTMTGRLVAPGRAELTLSDWPGVPDRSVRNFTLAAEAILAASGRGDPRVRWERSPDGARIFASWRPR